ncbi:MAG: hypothetical protein IJ600_09830 [Lachnospiraceae bacterium]|nr:hypothetical protein [Lachnospiraceae bacterium]
MVQMSGSDNRNKKMIGILFYAGIFFFCCIFFSQVHPLVPYDMDDWLYVGWRRNAYPLWKDWNPARVFPETFMSLISDLGVFVLKPVFHLEYLHALILAHAMTVGGFITVYMFMFRRFLQKRLRSEEAAAYLLTLLFLLFHFSIFRREHSGNQHLFWTFNLTGYYYYVLPNLMNASLVLFLAGTGREARQRLSLFQQGVLLLAVYLAVFSNLFSSVILAVWFAGEMLSDLWEDLQSKRKTKAPIWLREHLWHIGTLALWLVSLVYEANGGRAEGAGGIALWESIQKFLAWGGKLNLQTTALSVLLIAAALAVWCMDCRKAAREKRSKAAVKSGMPIPVLIFGTLVSAVFEVLLCAKVGTDKLEICRVIFSVCFFAFMIIFSSAAYLLKRQPYLTVLLPLILYVLLMNTRIGEHVFLEANGIDLDARLCIAIDRDIIEQAIAADRAGLDEALIYVPLEEEEENWPHVIRMGSALSQTLYKHGIISRRIDLTAVPDHAVNERFGLGY